MAQTKGDGIRFCVRGQLIHEAFVCERILKPRRRTQWSGPERRADVVKQHALTLDRSRSIRFRPDLAGDIGGDAIAAIVVAFGLCRGRSRFEWLGLETRKPSGDERCQERLDPAGFPMWVTTIRDPRR